MMTAMLLAQKPATIWMPEQASTVAGNVDWLFYFVFYTCLFFLTVIAAGMVYFAIKYRRRTQNDPVSHITHNTPLELAWSVGPSFLLVLMFWWGFKGFMDMRIPPPNSYEIKVNARQWDFDFTYPNGLTHEDLHIPVNRPVRLVMASADVLHACFIPAFRVKRDIVPGRYTDIWFEATKPGEYHLFCAEYCGTSHSDMNAMVVVHPKEATDKLPTFEKWLETADPITQLTPEQFEEYKKDADAFLKKYANDPVLGKIVPKLKTPVMMGEELYKKKKGCVQCHTIDGRASTGPTWKGVFGHDVVMADGSTVRADENYLRESMLDPNKKIVKGFPSGTMPKTKLSDREIDLLITYIKSVGGDSGSSGGHQ